MLLIFTVKAKSEHQIKEMETGEIIRQRKIIPTAMVTLYINDVQFTSCRKELLQWKQRNE